MRENDLRYFVCPSCHENLRIERADEKKHDRIKNGSLICSTGAHRFVVYAFVPRFVQPEVTTSAFGYEWNKHPRTQLDSENGMLVSQERFYRQTNWPKNLSGQKILEVGSGAGRFTEIAVKTGANVISVDASQAVDANWNNNGDSPNLILCQASLYNLPFRPGYFDKVFCFGVLQHTPDVSLAFSTIAKFVKPGGELVVDVYNKNYWRNYHTPIYLIRPITKRIAHDRLYRWISWLAPWLLPVSTWLRQNIPIIGWQMSATIPLTNYFGLLPTKSIELVEQYSILDTFDTLSPMYIKPERPEVVRQWFLDAGYESIEFDNATVFSMRGKRKLL